MALEPFGISHFCEDIRYETSGQVSLIGVFPGEIALPQFPVIMPKLGVVMRVHLPWGASIERLNWKIYLPGDEQDKPAFTTEIDIRANLQQQIGQDASDFIGTDVEISHNFQQHVLLSPALIKMPGFIRVRVTAGDYYIKSGAIKITKISQNA